MPVIALNQEMGSLGKDVAQALANDLGLSQVTHEVVDHVAAKMNTRRSLIRRVTEGKAGMIDRLRTDQQSVSTYVAEEVFDLAAQGNVIIRGWGATHLLRRIPHIPCIRVCAPLEFRKQWLMQRLETDDDELALEELRRSDAAHTHNMYTRFGVTWGDPLLYDLVLNTQRVSIDACVDQIKNLLGQPEFRETDASRKVLADVTLEAHIRAALKADEQTHEVDVLITADDGRVMLQGMVYSEEERVAAAKIAGSVKGVVSVTSELRALNSKLRDGE